MSHYDPAMEDEYDMDKEILVLPPKSPRGATPVKLRTSLTTSFLSSPAAMLPNQLSGISGGKIHLRKIGPLLDNDEMASIEAEVDEKLTKSYAVDDNEEYDADHYGSPSCKRKLLIDDDTEGVNDNKADDTDGRVVEGYTQETTSSLPPSSLDDLIAASEELIAGETTNEKATNVDMNHDQASVSSVPEKKVPPKLISNFFAPKGNAKHKVANVSIPSLSTTTTYKSPSTPLKKIHILEDSNVLSTPPQRIQPTPVPILSQRKTVGSSYDNYSRNDIAANHSSEEDEDVLPGYDSMDAYGGSYVDENVNEKLDNTCHAVPRRPYYGSSRLGQSRLIIKSNQQNNPYDRNRKSKSPYFHGTSVTSPTPYSVVQRGLNFDTSFSTSDSALAPSRNNGGNKYEWLDKRKDVYSHKNNTTIPSLSSTSVGSIPGIRNLGNTCYLSASLQALFSIPQFITDLYKTYAALSEGNKKMPLTKALLGVAVDIGVLIDNLQLLSSGSGSTMAAANPAALKKQMDVLTDKFIGYEQRDSHEFLSDLVDYLHDELEASPARLEGATVASVTTVSTGTSEQEEGRAVSPNENNHPNEAKNEAVGDEGKDIVESKSSPSVTASKVDEALLPTDEYFQLNVRVCLKCDSCGYSRSKDEMYRHLSVDVGEDSEIETWTVERSLQQFFQPEKRDLKCERCDAGISATQTLEIISCPKALILHFKRFIVTQEEQHGRKSTVETSDDKDQPVIPPRMEMVLRKNEVNMFQCAFIHILSLCFTLLKF
jgi:DNA-directed RNA polymerase subunit M/transcription elongation factor TFIIS